MPELLNNLDLYRHLVTIEDENARRQEYDRLAKNLPFKVKSLGFLMKKGAQVDSRAKAAIDA